MPELRTPWTAPYLIRLRREINGVPDGSVGTVVAHYEDGNAAEVEFYVSINGEEHDHYVETVELEDMDDA